MQRQPLEESELIKNEQQYRDQIATGATALLNQLFDEKSLPSALTTVKSLNILVPGAGTFPSYLPFMRKVTQVLPQLTEVRITILDSDRKSLQLFSRHFFESEKKALLQEKKSSHSSLRITLNSIPKSIGKFLNPILRGSEKFHLVYWEHPETSVFVSIISSFGYGKEIKKEENYLLIYRGWLMYYRKTR